MHDDITIEELPPAANGDAVWRVTGPLVITSFFEFQERVRADKSKTLALDFSGVPYVDSTGIGALMSIYASRQKDERRLLLVAVQPRVRTALKMMKVEQFFSFADTLPAQ
ncbi:MAG TPA: STAS domain-containing protein [Candidatus Angelobacter sp.]|jgi:anti-sigma B factor antagonist|nr:STAS domain-containing protein [Candidatus Angelobacter sp.]